MPERVDYAVAGRELDARLTAAMARAQDGDKAAYAVVLREAVPAIRRIARAQGAPADFVDDIVQDTLIAIHGAIRTFDPSRSFMAWLSAIAQRRTIDLLRRRGRLGVREVHSPLAYEGYAAADDPGREIERQEDAAVLRQAIEGLPERQREAVRVLALQEISLEDASRSTGRTKTALKVNLHRAIRSLRVRLGGPASEQDG